MKRYLCLSLITLLLGFGGFGCIGIETLSDNLKTLEEFSKDTKEKSDELIAATEVALARLSGIITKAEKDEPPKIAEGDPVVDLVKKGAGAAQPFLPFPFNVIVGLVPFGVAWFRARNREGKRTAEEGLLVVALQSLKKEDPAAFKKFIEYRDMAAKGVLTAKKTAELLEGINSIRAKFAA